MNGSVTIGDAVGAAVSNTVGEPVKADEDVTISPSQQRLWFLDQLRPGSCDHLLPLALRLRGELDVEALRVSLSSIVNRHEVLRTRFVKVDGEPRRVLDEPGGSILSLVDDRDAAEVFERELNRPIDLAQEPPVRMTLSRLGPSEHLLLIVVHHIAIDGWSWNIVLRELAAGYRGEPVAAPAMQYAQVAHRQQHLLTGPRMERQLAYWRERLTRTPPLALPTDRPRPAFWQGAGDVVRFTVPADLVVGVDELARAGRASRYMVLLGVYQALLSRYTAATDVAVCTTLASRNGRDTGDLVGPFVNTVVLRTDLSGRPSFRNALQRVRDTALGAFSHAEAPFDRVVKEVGGERDLSRHPLAQASFTLLNTVPQSVDLPGLQADLVAPPLSGTELDVFLDLNLTQDGGLAGRLQYATALFDEDTIRSFGAGYVQLLAAVLAAPDVPIADLAQEIALLPGREHQRLVDLAGSPSAPADRALKSMVPRAAGADDDIALLEDDQTITYQALRGRVGALAGLLAERGVMAGTRVGVCLPRGASSVTAMLAVWAAGGVYVPLDARFPLERLRYMVGEAGVDLVVADEPTLAMAERLGTAIVMVGRSGQDREAPTPLVGPHELAYVIFTSGSAGRPKAVGVEHGALSRHVSAARSHYQITAADRVLAFSSFTFDASLDQLLPALSAGASLLVRPDEDWLPSRIPQIVQQRQISVLNFPPTYWAELVSTLTERSASHLSSLRLLILGGEEVGVGALAQWSALVPDVRVVNAYGPTEVVVTSTVHDVSAASDVARVPIGRPLGQRRAYLVDDWGVLVPHGDPGELLIGGPELARGYLGRPDLTAERFVPDPFGVPGGRLYRTGDRARWLPNGDLEFLGRVDDQVKIRGHRVELGEVEATLSQAPGVVHGAAAVRPDAQGTASLVGYVVTGSHDRIDVPLLRDWCARSLPSYEIPSEFVQLDALPVTAAGKLDRSALPDPRPDRAAAGVSYTAPRDETERIIAQIWAEVLGVEQVGIDDGFFDLGGHSLLATMAVSRVAQRLGRDVELRTLFENPRIRAFAPRVEAARATASSGIVPLDRSQPLPLSFAQERLWFLDRLSDAGDDYVLWFSWRVRGGLDQAAWAGAVNDVVARHEVLRTALVEIGGRPMQRVSPAVTVPLTQHPVPVAAGLGHIREQARQFATRRFDLSRPPMVRAGLWELDPQDCVVVLAFHHVATDGWSREIIVEELMKFYRSRLRSAPVHLPPLPIQYADFASWQRGWVSGEVQDRQLAYWHETLRDVPVLELPTDAVRPPVWSGRGAAVDVPIDAELMAGLDELARHVGATRYMVLLAVFDIVLARWSGQDDIAVGTPVSGRGRIEVEGLVGFFVNTLVVRTDLSREPSFAELVGRVRERVLGAFDHQDVPFERVVEELRPQRELSRSSLFQVMFDVQEGAAAMPLSAELDFESFPLAWGSSKFDLTATFLLRPDRFTLNIEYATDLFAHSSVLRFAEHVNRVLAAVVADPYQPVHELDLLSAPERAELLRMAGDRDPGSAVAVHASGALGDVAVVCGEREITYETLLDMVAGLAELLMSRGVTPGSAVGVALPRGEWSIAAMLAIWAAGGVYVPLDTRFPVERLRYMVAEAGVGWVIAESPIEALEAEPVLLEQVRPSSHRPGHIPRPAELAYVIFTSGSSGRPKAVGVEHAALARHVAAAQEQFALTAQDVVLTFASLSFDASLEQILPALSIGARVVIRPEQMWTVEELAAHVRASGTTVMELAPSYWAEVVARLDDVAADLASLRLLITGGEVLPASPLRRWFEVLPGVPVVNTYGPTESVISASAYRVNTPVLSRVPIGRPLGGRRLYVVDALGRLVPPGAPGELLVGGPELARGYLGRPGLTAGRFVPDAFSPTATGGRLYRTGDQVRWNRDGNLEFLGRVDNQLSIRGFRIEPGEIEAVLREHPDVQAAAVTARDVRGEATLVAYVAGSRLDPSSLAPWCRRMLPEYMVPTAFVPLQAMPLSVQGKLDVAALPAPEPLVVEFEPPNAPTEMVIAQIWAEVLNVDRVGLRDNFFALGGHSLRAVAVISRLRDAFDCEIQVRHLFENPTVGRLAAEVERQVYELISAMSDEEIDLSLA